MADARDLFGMNMLHAPRFFLMRRMNVDNDAAFLLVSSNSEQVISEAEFVRLFEDAAKTERSAPRTVLGGDFRTKIYTHWFGESAPYGQDYHDGLVQLGQAMTSTYDPTEDSDIPAGYTYFGQFLAHDLTQGRKIKGSDVPKNFQTPVLDLDSIYGPDDDSIIRDGRKLRIGSTYGGTHYKSLPRDLCRAEDGTPAVGNPRNDDSLLLSQMHVLVVSYHNCLADTHPSLSYEQVRDAVILTLQAIAIYDYLPRIVPEQTIDDVIRHKRSYWRQSLGRQTYGGISAEAAFAGMRFGHSMVRPSYHGWNAQQGQPRDTPSFLSISYIGHALDHCRVPSDWLPDWTAMFGAAGQDATLMARRIDCVLTGFTREIPEDHLPADDNTTSNLAVRNLQLGARARLKSGVEVRNELANAGFASSVLDYDSIVSDAPGIRAVLLDGRFGELRERPPLWYYILREAEFANTGKLAGVGAQIVCETLAACVELATPSLFSMKGDLPIGSGDPASIRMSDLIAAVGNPDWYSTALN